MSLHHLFQGSLDGVKWEAEVGVAAAEGQLSPIGALNLSRLAIDSDWCPQQEKVVVVCCVSGEPNWAWDGLGMRWRLFRGHGCSELCLHEMSNNNCNFLKYIPLGSLCQMPDELRSDSFTSFEWILERTVSRQPGSVMYIHHSG